MLSILLSNFAKYQALRKGTVYKLKLIRWSPRYLKKSHGHYSVIQWDKAYTATSSYMCKCMLDWDLLMSSQPRDTIKWKSELDLDSSPSASFTEWNGLFDLRFIVCCISVCLYFSISISSLYYSVVLIAFISIANLLL